MRRPVFLLLLALLPFAPAAGQAGAVKMGFFQSSAIWYGPSFANMVKAIGAGRVDPGSGVHVAYAPKTKKGWGWGYPARLDAALMGVAYLSPAKSKPFAEMPPEREVVAGIDYVSGVDVPRVMGAGWGRKYDTSVALHAAVAGGALPFHEISKSMAKFYNLDGVVPGHYWLRPICCTPVPPCCPCPCPCPDPSPFPNLRGKSPPPDMHGMKPWPEKAFSDGVKLTLNAENLGPIVDDAMRKLAIKYSGFRKEYIASGSVKLEPRIKAEPLK